MRKVLIITYYWPPSGGSGVQRWLKFAKYLPQYGWQPYVFTPENPSFEVRDESLIQDISDETEVYKLPIWEPYVLLDNFKRKGQSQQSDLVKKKKGLLAKMMLWARGNLLIPDPRIFWVRPAVKVLGEILASNGIDTIITTGPPHSMHLIGLKLRQKYNIKWIADFRDPWTQWDLYDNFYLSRLGRHRHAVLEKKVLQTADQVITVSEHYAMDLEEIGRRAVEVITNGFDEEEFSRLPAAPYPEAFIIRHVGVVDELRDPRPFLKAIEMLAEEGHPFQVEFVGNTNQSLKDEVADNEILNGLIAFRPYVPHAEALKLYKGSAVLLLILANSRNAPGNIPGKLFEYLAAMRPVLAIGHEKGDSAKIIKDTGAGIVCERANIESIKKGILQLHDDFEKKVQMNSTRIMQYSRKSLTKKLAGVLNAL